MTGPESDSLADLDEAFERMAGAGFELPNGFVNHGAMACEALAALGFGEEIGRWARRFSSIAGPAVTPSVAVAFDWREALGEYGRLPEWIGHFETAIAEEGWSRVVEIWVPRLLPGLATALFHGAIRTAHAVRAVDAIDTRPRRGELARALGYWAARFRPGRPAVAAPEVEDLRSGILSSAAEAARFYVGAPSIYHLHGVTGAMAVEILAGHIPASAAEAGLAQVKAEHTALFAGAAPATDLRVTGMSDGDLARRSEASGDPHEVKLVEACRRAWTTSDDLVFAAAAETVVGGPRAAGP